MIDKIKEITINSKFYSLKGPRIFCMKKWYFIFLSAFAIGGCGHKLDPDPYFDVSFQNYKNYKVDSSNELDELDPDSPELPKSNNPLVPDNKDD